MKRLVNHRFLFVLALVCLMVGGMLSAGQYSTVFADSWQNFTAQTDDHSDDKDADHDADSGDHDADADHSTSDELHEEVESKAIHEAMELGDAENGKVLFNTITSTGFACATCHYVDSMEMLVGPGLLGVGEIGHDPSAHAAEGDADHAEGDADADHAEGDADADHAEGDADADHAEGDADADHAEGDADADHAEGDADADHAEGEGDADHTEGEGDADHTEMDMDHDAEATPEADMHMDMDMEMEDPGVEVVEYLRTSILNPSAFVVEGFVDNLMPQNFGEVFTEQEINDLVAYLLTLKHEE